MKDTMGLIITGENEVGLESLTKDRSIAVVPTAGRYRMIDFILSNMVNSGIKNVGVITMNKYYSLIDHLDSGKQWDLNRKKDGLFILPPYVKPDDTGGPKGNIEAMHNIMAYLERSTQKHVILGHSHVLCNMTYEDAMNFHINKRSDITVLYNKDNNLWNQEYSKDTLIEIDDHQRIYNIKIDSAKFKSNNISMGMFIMEKELLKSLVEDAFTKGESDFVKDILMKKLNELKIYAYEYNGYVARMNSILAYYRHNMELLNPIKRYKLFFSSGAIYTKVKDKVPAKYSDGAIVENSMIADGCIIEGNVKNSILFRGVKVEKGARVCNSIIMQDSLIQQDTVLKNTILDKQVVVRRETKIIGLSNMPIVLEKKMVV